MSFWASSPERRKARKPHTCMLCCEPIEPGTTYERWCSGYDGVTTVKVHAGCWEMVQEYGFENGEGFYEITYETWEEAYDNTPDIARLALLGGRLTREGYEAPAPV